MKTIKKFFVFAILISILGINISNAEWQKLKLEEIKALTNKTIELRFDNQIKASWELKSDLEILKSIENTSKKDEKDSKKVILNLKWALEANKSYSLIAVSGADWGMIFKTENDFVGKEIKNPDLQWDETQWIKSIFIKENNIIEVNFLDNVVGNDLEIQLYKSILVDKIKAIPDSVKVKALLKNELLDNSEYLWTITNFETNSWEKIEVDKWMYYFTTEKLEKYDVSKDKTFTEDKKDEKSLENDLMKALDNNWQETSSWEKLNSEKELQEELNSAGDDPANKKQTQLEKLALSKKQTPESGAETWVLILATFILNTFWFLSRRKKS